MPVSSASVSALPMPEEQASWSVRHSQGSIIVHPTALVHPDAVLMEVRFDGLTWALAGDSLLIVPCLILLLPLASPSLAYLACSRGPGAAAWHVGGRTVLAGTC